MNSDFPHLQNGLGSSFIPGDVTVCEIMHIKKKPNVVAVQVRHSPLAFVSFCSKIRLKSSPKSKITLALAFGSWRMKGLNENDGSVTGGREQCIWN